jgi:hypothetical protein
MAQREPISTLKILTCRKYSIQKLTKFSQGNNMLDAAASDIDGFLREINKFFNSLQWDYWEEIDHISNFKNLHCKNDCT